LASGLRIDATLELNRCTDAPRWLAGGWGDAAVEFGTLTRRDGKVIFRELTVDEITKLLKDADLDKKEDEGARA
jgi:hypothetical protein